MKKLLLILCVLISVNSFCQDVELKTTKMLIGRWDNRKDTWVYGNYIYGEATFKLSGRVLSVDDRNNSVYVINSEVVKDNTDEYRSSVFEDVMDNDGKRCAIMLLNRTDEGKTINIIYNNKIFKYYLDDTKTLSDF